MKLFISLIVFFLVLINSQNSFSEDALTIKQQLDRIKEEIKDLNKAVFNKSFDNNQVDLDDGNIEAERFTSIDIRIYDLEKDIKNLTLLLEETLFQLEDLSVKVLDIEQNLSNNLNSIQDEINIIKNAKNINKETETFEQKEKNTLGKIIISESDAVSKNIDNKNEASNQEEQTNKEVNLLPEEQLQMALDQMMKKNYENSKQMLENFISKYPDNQLSGSAHYWLGKIYLFESNFRGAAIVFGEGVQKFPESIKAAEMYYELSKSLIEMNKNSEACKTLALLNKNYKNNKFAKDPEKIQSKLNCESQNNDS